MKFWSTSVYLEGGEGHNRTVIASHKSYNAQDIRGIINQMRAAEMAEGKPRRKLKPATRYLLEDLIRKYFEESAPKGITLEMIVIEDRR